MSAFLYVLYLIAVLIILIKTISYALWNLKNKNICACALVMTAAAAELMLFLYNKLTLYR